MAETPSAAMPFASRYVEILGSRIHYVDEGDPDGPPILMIHGNPTHLYLWRNVVPHLTGRGRVVALDLIGMGKSDKPDIDYTFADHAAYLEGFIDALGIRRNLTLVDHDWGSGLGFDYAARHPEAIRAVAFMEAQAAPVLPASFADIPPDQAELFRAFRDPEQADKMIGENNMFIEMMLPGGTSTPLSAEAHEAYREPFRDPSDRKPMIVWPAELPIDGEPAGMVERANRWNDWLATSQVPKLALHAEPGQFMPKAAVEVMARTFPNLTARGIGEGLHFVQESQPDAIGREIAAWLDRVS